MESARLPRGGRPLYTVGHSIRSLDELVGLLKSFGIEHLVDVRTVRRSRRNPQFNETVIGAALSGHGIGYAAMPALGGLRGRSKTVPPETNAGWTESSFHNYADHALGEEFAAALEELAGFVERQRTVVMCAEAVWWRCHRRIIADWWIARGGEVIHVMGTGKGEAGRISSFATVGSDRRVRYPKSEAAG